MATEDEYRTVIGFCYGGPYERKAGDHTVYTYSFSAVGLNGDVQLKLDFWDDDPDYIEVGPAYLISGKYSTWTSPDGEKSSKTLNVNKLVPLGESIIKAKGKRPAPKKKPAPKGEAPEFDF